MLVADIPGASVMYTERLGYRPQSAVIHDPAQTAHVQFFALGSATVLLELIAPDGAASRLSTALQRGGGLHHLCYSTTDIDASCRELVSAGLALIRRPEPAVAFGGRRIAWMAGKDRLLTELVERGSDGGL